jgi:hypothetical protein
MICWGATGTLLEHWGHHFGRWEDLIPIARQALTEMALVTRIGAGVTDAHQCWCDVLAAEGWTYAEIRDEANLCHPWLCPWRTLDEGGRIFFKMHHHIVLFLAMECPEGGDFAWGLSPRRLPAT